MDIKKKQRQYRAVFCLFVILCTILFILSIYLQRPGTSVFMGNSLNFMFYLMTLTGAWGFWKHRALKLSNLY